MRTAALLLLLAGPAAACPSCIGLSDGSGVWGGIWWGIVVLLVTTMTLVAGFAYTLWRVERARNLAERA